jgi:hypothetical protein
MLCQRNVGELCLPKQRMGSGPRALCADESARLVSRLVELDQLRTAGDLSADFHPVRREVAEPSGRAS